jgi:hypothetical protein
MRLLRIAIPKFSRFDHVLDQVDKTVSSELFCKTRSMQGLRSFQARMCAGLQAFASTVRSQQSRYVFAAARTLRPNPCAAVRMPAASLCGTHMANRSVYPTLLDIRTSPVTMLASQRTMAFLLSRSHPVRRIGSH